MPYSFDEFAQQTIDFTDEATAAAYDAKQATDIEAERALAETLDLGPEHTVIEFGPGTGALSLALAERCTHVYAVDTSVAMLRSSSDVGVPTSQPIMRGF